MFYSLKYTSKIQKAIENMAVLMTHAVAARIKRERDNDEAARLDPSGATPVTVVARGASRCMSAAHALTGQTETMDTLACLYLLRGSRVYSSHLYARLFLMQTLAVLNAEEHRVPVVRIGPSTFTGVTQYMDYVFRPNSLDSLNYYTFVSEYQRVPLSTKEKSCWKVV